MGSGGDPMDLPSDSSDGQCRYLGPAINGVLVASIYAPNGNPQPGPKFDYKLTWLKRLNAHAAELYATGAPVALAGDYNVVPTDLDIYPTKSWDRDALLQPESRAAYQRHLAQGWTDAVRALHPKEPMYTFWDYMRCGWERDGGHPATLGATASPKAKRSTYRTRRKEHATGGSAQKRPLLVIDGDSFAHRSYHALPKTIRRSDGNGAGAIVGFANFLLRFYGDEQPRAVIVRWDSLGVPKRRHEMFPAYQSGRTFDEELIEQLNVLPDFEPWRFGVRKSKGGEEARDRRFASPARRTLQRG